MIVKRGQKWCLLSRKTKRNLGCYPTREGAVRREGQVQFFKRRSAGFGDASAEYAEWASLRFKPGTPVVTPEGPGIMLDSTRMIFVRLAPIPGVHRREVDRFFHPESVIRDPFVKKQRARRRS